MLRFETVVQVEGGAALWYACKYAQPSCVRALLAAKASAQQKSHTLRVAAGGLRSQGFLSFNSRRSATERLHEVFALDFCSRKKAVTSWETASSIDILLFFGECRERGCGGTCALKAELGLHEVA